MASRDARRTAAWAFVENWPTLILRGGAGLLAGAALLTTPRNHPEFLIPLLATYLCVDGFFTLLGSLRVPGRRRVWTLPAAHGALTFLLGVLAWRLPDDQPVQLLALVATYALARGILESAAAIELRAQGLPERSLALSAGLCLLAAWVLILVPHLGLRGTRAIGAVQLLAAGIALIHQGLRLRATSCRESRPGTGAHAA
jgi:uncharacterized membrane protein HdeD (DUF308 family)